MWGSSADTPTEAKAPFDIDADSTNTTQEARPVKYFAGKHRLAMDYIAPAYGPMATKVKTQSSSKGSGAGGNQYKYSCDLAGILGCGVYFHPDQKMRITRVIKDHAIMWDGTIEVRPDHPYETFVVPKLCTVHVWWGKDDQDVPAPFPFKPSRTAEPEEHPAYRGFCTVWLENFQLGQGITQAGTIEFVVERDAAWFVDEDQPGMGGDGVNPIAAVYEAFADPWFGMGRPDSFFHKPSWLAALDALSGTAISPYCTQGTGFREWIATLLEYFDGWLRPTNGQLEIGFWKHGDVDLSDVVELTDADLVEKPQIKSNGYKGTKNRIEISFRDVARFYKVCGDSANDPNNRRLQGGKLDRERVDCTFFITAQAAADYMQRRLRFKSQPVYAGPITALRERVKDVRPGQLIKLSSTSYALSIYCRVLKKTTPADNSGTCQLELESERGLYPALYLPPALPRDPDLRVVPEKITHARIVELPSGLKDAAGIQVGILAERPDGLLIGFRIHLSPDGTSYDEIAHEASFAVRGTLAIAFAATDTGEEGFRVDLTGAVDEAAIVEQSAQQQADNALLCWLGDEIVSIGAITALGGHQYQVSCTRALFATAAANHFSASTVWFAFRQSINRVQHASFAIGETSYFKLQSHIRESDEDLSECDVFTHTFGLADPVGSTFGIILGKYAKSDANGNIESHLTAAWQFPAGQKIFLFEIRSKPTAADDSAWFYQTTKETSLDWRVAPSTPFDVEIRPITSDGNAGAWSPLQHITSATTAAFEVVNLEVVGANGLGKGNDWTFDTPDVHVQCQVTSIRYESLGQETSGAQGALEDPRFGGLVWRIRDSATGAVVWGGPDRDVTTKVGDWKFRKTENALAFGGTASPQFLLAVAPRDREGNLGEWKEIEPDNEPPPAPSALSAVAAYQGLQAAWKNTVVSDLAGNDLLIGTTSNVAAAKSYDIGLTEIKTLQGFAAAAIVYLWVREYDTFGSRSPLTGPYAVTVGTVAAKDIVGLSTQLSRQYPNTVEIEGIIWGNNDPAAGSISWTCPTNGPCISWNGNQYKILSNSTDLEFVWWRAGDLEFSVSDTNPETDPAVTWDPQTCFQIARNYLHAGIAQQVWVFTPNATVGSLYVLDAAIKNGVFGNLIADTANIIGDLQLQGQVVILPFGRRRGVVEFAPASSSDDSYFTIIALRITGATGAPASITGKFYHADDASFDSIGLHTRLLRDGVPLDGASDLTLPSSGNTLLFPIDELDDTGLNVGTVIYEFQLRAPKAGTAGRWNAGHIRFPTLKYMEMKKGGNEPYLIYDTATGEIVANGVGTPGSAADQIIDAEAPGASLGVMTVRGIPARQIVDITATPDPITGHLPIITNPLWSEP